MIPNIFKDTRVNPHLFVLVLVATLLAAGYSVGLTPAHAQVTFEHLVIDGGAGTGLQGALFQVDILTGNRTIVNDFGDVTQGPTGVFPVGVWWIGNGAVVVDRDAGTGGLGALFLAVFGGDPLPSRTLISDFGNPAQGPLGVNPSGVSSDTVSYLVVDPDAGTSGRGALFRVDFTTGARTVLSDFGDARGGSLGDSPTGVVADSAGTIAVIDPGAGTNGQGALFVVDGVTGARTLLSDFGNASQGPVGNSPTGVSIDGTTLSYVVVDPDAGTNLKGLMVLVDPATGTRTVLSDFGDPGKGPTGESPIAVDGAFAGVLDNGAGTAAHGALFSYDATTGNRALVSDFGNAAQGPLGVKPSGLSASISCPALLAVTGTQEPKTTLGLLYDVRDKVLAKTFRGRRYIKLFYANALETSWLMLRHPELRTSARSLIERFVPTLQAIVGGKTALISSSDLAAIDGLLQAVAEKASAKLRADIGAVQTDLHQAWILREFGLILWR